MLTKLGIVITKVGNIITLNKHDSKTMYVPNLLEAKMKNALVKCFEEIKTYIYATRNTSMHSKHLSTYGQNVKAFFDLKNC
jgi:hypothetical protein